MLVTSGRYRLKDDGYPSFQWIVRGRDRVGRVIKNADGSFTGIIRQVQAQGNSWADALNQVVAEVEGIDLSELGGELVEVKPVRERTQAILAWLINHAEANDGHLAFNNTDLAQAAGWPRPNQALGNITSRLDLCCAKAGLPPISCAADKSFRDAYANRGQRDWDFPIEQMRRRAKSHLWTKDDFEQINRENRALLIGSAYLAWGDYIAKHEAKLKEWAFM